MKFFNKKYSQGFTLVEMLVVVGIFSVLITMFGGIFVKMLNLERRGQGAQKIQENATFALELMARELRVSTLSPQEADCGAVSLTTLNLVHPVNGAVTYSLNGTVIQRIAGGITTNITSQDIKVTSLRFCVQGSDVDQQQARVAILMTVQDSSGQVSFSIETTVATREMNTEQ